MHPSHSNIANSDNQTEERIKNKLQPPQSEAPIQMEDNSNIANTFQNKMADTKRECRVPEERSKKDAASSGSVSKKEIVQKQQQTQKQRQKQMRLRTPSWAQSTTTTKTYLYSSI